MDIRKIIYAVLGTISLALAFVAIVLPLIPTVPFALLSAFCFARSSDKLNDKFKQSGFYKKYIAVYKEKKGMPFANKVKVILVITLLLLFAFYKMGSVPVGRAVIVAVWLGHVYYFFFKMKTIG